jgi:hypothetical protein
MPKVVPVDQDNPGGLVVNDGARGWWHVGHLLALAAKDQIKSAQPGDGTQLPSSGVAAPVRDLARLQQGTTVLELAGQIAEINGRDVDVTPYPEQPQDLAVAMQQAPAGTDFIFGTRKDIAPDPAGHNLQPGHWYRGHFDGDHFTLKNPWGVSHSGPLSAAELLTYGETGHYLTVSPKPGSLQTSTA